MERDHFQLHPTGGYGEMPLGLSIDNIAPDGVVRLGWVMSIRNPGDESSRGPVVGDELSGGQLSGHELT